VRDEFYRQTRRIEDEHWWFVTRRQLVDALVVSAGGPPPGTALDLGCGSGGNLAFLEKRFETVYGLDRSRLALSLARERGGAARLLQAEINSLSDLFRPASFAWISLFNVLYHRWVTDDARVVLAAADLLVPGGLMVLTEPAFESLHRVHDVVDQGARRYRLRELRRMIEEAGLHVERATYFNSASFVPAWLLARFERASGRLARAEAGEDQVSELGQPAAALRGCLVAWMRWERRWLNDHSRVPFGVSAALIARRPLR